MVGQITIIRSLGQKCHLGNAYTSTELLRHVPVCDPMGLSKWYLLQTEYSEDFNAVLINPLVHSAPGCHVTIRDVYKTEYALPVQ